MSKQDPIKFAMQLLGIDAATLKKMAHQLDTPELRETFEKHVQDKGFHEAIAELEQQLNEVFDHAKKSPNVRGDRD